MAISRYAEFETVKDQSTNRLRLESFPYIRAEELYDSVNDVIITFTDGMRIDTLAQDYLGDGRYWWVICLINDLDLPFGDRLLPGTVIRIPTNVSIILDKIANKIKKAI